MKLTGKPELMTRTKKGRILQKKNKYLQNKFIDEILLLMGTKTGMCRFLFFEDLMVDL